MVDTPEALIIPAKGRIPLEREGRGYRETGAIDFGKKARALSGGLAL
jgi:hypothetical protein